MRVSNKYPLLYFLVKGSRIMSSDEKSITIQFWDGIIGAWMNFDDVEYETVDEAKEAIAVAKASYDYRFRVYIEETIEV